VKSANEFIKSIEGSWTIERLELRRRCTDLITRYNVIKNGRVSIPFDSLFEYCVSLDVN